MTDRLLPIGQIIQRAKNRGINLGQGDPKIHLAYLTKIGLLPKAVKRKVTGKMTGCYPLSALSTLEQIENRKMAGQTYSQIRFQTLEEYWIDGNDQAKMEGSIWGQGIAFLVIGLVLGYLLATVGVSRQTERAFQTAGLPAGQAGIIKSDSRGEEPLFVIAVPSQNLYRLGKTDINLLIK